MTRYDFKSSIILSVFIPCFKILGFVTILLVKKCMFHPKLKLVVLQLRIEQKRGRVFVGWNEGKIYFPPTYKYSTNSDRYAGDDMHPKEKRRTPAW